MTAPRLIDLRPERRETFHTGSELVPLAGGECPQCASPLARWVQYQDSLVRGGGYGGTQRVETDSCAVCLFERVAAVATTRPPK